MKPVSAIGALILVIVMFVPSPAQLGQGGLRGRVLDREGKPLQGAIVRIEHLSSRVTDETKTARNGSYSFSGLYQGQYKVTVIVDGRVMMSKGESVADAVYVSNGTDAAVSFDLKNAPATPPPTPVSSGTAAASGTPAAAAPDAPKSSAEKKASDEMRAAFSAGVAAMGAKNYEEAVKQFQLAAEKDATQPMIFGNLGLALSNLKKYDDAVAAYRKSIALKPDDPSTHALASLALASAGKIDDAIKEVQEAAKLDPTLGGQSYYNVGAILTNAGKSKEAVEVFKKAIEIDPKNARSYYELGLAYFASAETIPDAVSALEKFLQLKPSGQDAEAARQLIEAAKAQLPAGSSGQQKQQGKTKQR